MNFRRGVAVLLLGFGMVAAFSEGAERYRIGDVTFKTAGRTQPYALELAVDVDKNTVFDTRDAIEAYIADYKLQLENQRVLDSVAVQIAYGTPDAEGIARVNLDIATVDTWNIMLVPYPKFDSNTGFQLKLKLKDYNFFGSMQPLTFDLISRIDENKEAHLGGSISFEIPFRAMDHDMVWNFESTLDVPFKSAAKFKLASGLDVIFPLSRVLDLHTGFVQSVALNDRNAEDVLYAEDTHYFTEKIYANLPVQIGELDHLGKVYWTPDISLTVNLEDTGIQSDDLKSPDFAVSHTVSFGRVDWINNFREGLSFNLGNSWTYDFGRNVLSPQIEISAQGYKSFFDRIGITAQGYGITRLDGSFQTNVGERLRGISDSRIKTDTAVVFNFDLPVRIFRLDFSTTTSLKKLDIFSFELQLSPFFDMALTHDRKTGQYFSLSDGWYAGGLEMIVYPKKMRSIYARASIGFDLPELVANDFKIGAKATRDGASIYDISIGIGLHY